MVREGGNTVGGLVLSIRDWRRRQQRFWMGEFGPKPLVIAVTGEIGATVRKLYSRCHINASGGWLPGTQRKQVFFFSAWASPFCLCLDLLGPHTGVCM